MESEIRIFHEKMKSVYEVFGLNYEYVLTSDDFGSLESSNFDQTLDKFKTYLEASLGKMLLSNHQFLEACRVRKFVFENNKTINVAIINKQSSEWYDSENSICSFDFLLEDKLGLFDGCKTFLDLGGHQLIWSIYYAKKSDECTVDVYEPSILNVCIGLFNCLINGVIHQVNVFPYAISIKSPDEKNHDEDKMLVDFINTPVKTNNLIPEKSYDFIKVDIEGYEYELLQDKTFLELIKKSNYVHFELHLGHLINRSVTYNNCLDLLKSNQIVGMELYSQKDMYQFLEESSKDGFYGLVFKR